MSNDEVKKPELNRKKAFIEIRDRARPNVAFQQGDNFFDRKGHFVEKAPYAISIKESPPVEVKTRDITERARHEKTPNKSTRKPLSLEDANRPGRLAAALKAAATSEPKAVTDALKENAKAAGAERNSE